MNERLIELIDVNKIFEEKVVLKNINLFVRKNEFMTILGPSGCGKTTTLRIIGGFETVTSGKLLLNGNSILDLPPHKRNVNTVFQKYALFPNMDVYENIAFGLKIKKIKGSKINEKITKMLKLVNLDGYGKRKITNLSGGEQQRVAIARALVNEPEMLLLDEPLGALDLKLRKEMQLELKNMHRQLGITFVYVTHDQEEALTMSDTITVMDKGKIQQIGSPEDIYNEPKNAFTANFIGVSNILDGIMTKDLEVEFLGKLFKCIDKKPSSDTLVEVVVRPEDIQILQRSTVNENCLQGIVIDASFFGVHYEMLVKVLDYTFKVHSTLLVEKGAKVDIIIPIDAIHIMKKGA